MNLYVIIQNEKVNKIFTERTAAELYIKLNSMTFKRENEQEYFIEEHEVNTISIECMENKYKEYKEAGFFGYGFFFDQHGNVVNQPQYQRIMWRDLFSPVKEKGDELLVVVDWDDESIEGYERSLQRARDMRSKYIMDKFGIS